MAESNSSIHPDNFGTFITGAYIIGVLALVAGLFAFREARTAGVGAVALEMRDMKQEAAASKADEARIKALEDRITALEGRMAAPAPAEPALTDAAPAAK